MTTVTIDLPDALLMDDDMEAVSQDVRLSLAVDWYRRGLISQGRASEFAGIPRAAFMEELAARKIPVAQVDIEQLKAELRVGQG